MYLRLIVLICQGKRLYSSKTGFHVPFLIKRLIFFSFYIILSSLTESICLSVLCLLVSVMFCFHNVIIDYCHMQSLPLVTNIHFVSKQRDNTQFFFQFILELN